MGGFSSLCRDAVIKFTFELAGVVCDMHHLPACAKLMPVFAARAGSGR